MPRLGNNLGFNRTGGAGYTHGTSSTSRTHAPTPTSSWDGIVSGGHQPTRSSRAGQAGTTSSEAGFGFMQRLANWGTKKLVIGALGFALLFPPIAGQFMNPGFSHQPVSSPVAMQVMQRGGVGSGAELKGEAQSAQAKIPGGTGAARELAVVELIAVSQKADKQAAAARKLWSEASQVMEQLKQEVGLDARLGFVADVYWFGVPAEHHVYHQGKADAGELDGVRKDIGSASESIRQTARGEVSNLLEAESSSYKELKADYTLAHARLGAAERIESLAKEAREELSSAESWIMLRNVTPKTVTVQDYETKVTVDADGNTHSEQVHVGSHEEPNPTWDTYNLAAIAAKANAESAIRGLNETINASRHLLGDAELNTVDADLIGFLDFFGHPSFLLWSFDSFDVSTAKDKVGALEGAADALGNQIRPVHDQLERSVNRAIDARWEALVLGHGSFLGS